MVDRVEKLRVGIAGYGIVGKRRRKCIESLIDIKLVRRMLCGERLKKMKEGSVLINAARGGIVDEIAVKSLLITGHISAAAFDVFEVEPAICNELLHFFSPRLT